MADILCDPCCDLKNKVNGTAFYREMILLLLCELKNGSGNLNALATFTTSQTSVPDSTSTEAIAANTSRKAGSYLVNNTDQTFYINFGAVAAIVGAGPFVVPGGIFKFDTTQAINVIQNSGGALTIDIVEAA